jgi:hypothetical protein
VCTMSSAAGECAVTDHINGYGMPCLNLEGQGQWQNEQPLFVLLTLPLGCCVVPCHAVCFAGTHLRCDPYTNWLLTGQDMNVCW